MKIFKKLPLLIFLLSTVLLAQNGENIPLKSYYKTKELTNVKSLNFGGRIMFDNAFFSESKSLKDSYSEEQSVSGNKFRRLFLYAAGTMYMNIEYKLQVNLINGGVGLRDAYIGFKNIPVVGNVRLGQVKEPIRLSVLNSSNYLTFLERSFNVDFLPIRNSGVLFMNDVFKGKVSYQLGLFRNSDKNTGDDIVSKDSFVITGRFSGMPIHQHNEFLHLGVAGSYRQYDDHIYKVTSKPEANLSNISYVSISGLTDVDHVNILNSEIAYGYKSLNFQGEYMYVDVNRVNSSNLFSTFYGQASWFITGEQKEIKDSYNMFKRLKPKNNLGNTGKGAWEVALRYSYVDMNSKDVLGGTQQDITFGLNWYLNPNVRFMFNEVYADVENNGAVYISQLRAQIDF